MVPDSATFDPQTKNLVGEIRRGWPRVERLTVAGKPVGEPAPPLRAVATNVRKHALSHLEHYIEVFADRFVRSGGHMHRAADASAALNILRGLVSEHPGPWTICESTESDEIKLNDALRRRRKPKDASLSVRITSARFAVAQTGHLCIVDPDFLSEAGVRIVLATLESILPRWEDLAVMLKAIAGAAGALPDGLNLFHPATATGATHLLLIDNGRGEMLRGEFADALRCIGCGACSRVCPVYGAINMKPRDGGPIGAVTLPVFRGTAKFSTLPFASTLCGACADVCPVGIDIPKLLLATRQRVVDARANRFGGRIRARWRAWVLRSPWRYRWLWRMKHPRDAVSDEKLNQSFHDLWHNR